jgi:hypothetical protein
MYTAVRLVALAALLCSVAVAERHTKQLVFSAATDPTSPPSSATTLAIAGDFGFASGATVTLNAVVTVTPRDTAAPSPATASPTTAPHNATNGTAPPPADFVSTVSDLPVLFLKVYAATRWRQLNALQPESHHPRLRDCYEPAVAMHEIVADGWPTTTVDAAVTVSHGGRYAVVLQLCSNVSVDVDVVCDLVNPGGVQASVEVIPLVNIFVAAAIAHFVLFFLWTGRMCWRAYRRCTQPRILWAFCVMMLLHGIVSAVASAHSSSLLTKVNPDEALRDASTAIKFVADIGMILFLLLLSIGKTLSRAVLTWREVQVVGGAVAVHAVFKVMHIACAVSPIDSCSAVSASEAATRFLCLILSSGFMGHQMETIHHRLSESRTLDEAAEETNTSTNTTATALFCDFRMYLIVADFRMPYFIYVVSSVIGFTILSIGVTSDEAYVEPLWNEICAVYLFLTLIYHFSPVYKPPPTHAD